MANKKYLEQRIRAEKEKALLAKQKKLRIFPLLSLGVTVILLLLIMVNWAGIYNTSIDDYEVKFTGFQCIVAGLGNNYTSINKSAFGDIAAPFYYYLPNLTKTLGAISSVLLFVLIVHILIELFAAITNKQGIFNYLGIGFALAEGVLFIVCYATALSMEDVLIEKYCNGNPACSIQSGAIIPALIAILSIAIPVLAIIFTKRMQGEVSQPAVAPQKEALPPQKAKNRNR